MTREEMASLVQKQREFYAAGNTAVGFCGAGESGMGAYHGKAGFDAFTHYRSMVNKSTRLDLSMGYQPYTPEKERTIRQFLK